MTHLFSRILAEDSTHRRELERVRTELTRARQAQEHAEEQLGQTKCRLAQLEEAIKSLDLNSVLAELAEAVGVEVERRREEEAEAEDIARVAQRAARMLLADIVSSELARMVQDLRGLEEEMQEVVGGIETLSSRRTLESLQRSWMLSLVEVARISKKVQHEKHKTQTEDEMQRLPGKKSCEDGEKPAPAPAPAPALRIEELSALLSMTDAMAVEVKVQPLLLLPTFLTSVSSLLPLLASHFLSVLSPLTHVQELVNELVHDSRHSGAIMRNLEEEKKALHNALYKFYQLPSIYLLNYFPFCSPTHHPASFMSAASSYFFPCSSSV
eukprot:747948-Hanusia_phi.AAC.1